MAARGVGAVDMDRSPGRFLFVIGGVALIAAPAWGQGQSDSKANVHSGRSSQEIVIRGEAVGFVSVSPALQKAIEARTGKKPDVDPQALGPNTELRNDGFTYVSPSAKGKKN